jgi:hypothetical protein
VPPPERVARFAVPFARPVAPLAVLRAPLVDRRAVLLARLVAPLAVLRALLVVLRAVLLARLVVRPAAFAPAFARRVAALALRLPRASPSARLLAAFAADLTALPADVAVRFAACLVDPGPPAAALTVARAERAAVLPLFAAALAWRVAAAFFAAADLCALV